MSLFTGDGDTAQRAQLALFDSRNNQSYVADNDGLKYGTNLLAGFIPGVKVSGATGYAIAWTMGSGVPVAAIDDMPVGFKYEDVVNGAQYRKCATATNASDNRMWERVVGLLTRAAGSPHGQVTGAYQGQLCYDVTNDELYYCIGAGTTNWKHAGAAAD